MTRKDRDFEPGRIKKGSDRARWFFGKLGIKSARQLREDDEAREPFWAVALKLMMALSVAVAILLIVAIIVTAFFNGMVEVVWP